MIQSMTAYARAEIMDTPYTVLVEIRSFNSRHLDIVFHLPHHFMDLEKKLQTMVNDKLVRGRVEIRLQVEEENSAIPNFTVNEPLATAYYQALETLKNHLGIKEAVTLGQMMEMRDIIQTSEIKGNSEDCEDIIRTCLSQGLSDLISMRQHEGDMLAADIDTRLTFIEKELSEVKKKSNNLLPLYHERLMEKLRVLTEDHAGIDPDRVAREAALLADRSDISEEIVRAQSHLTHFRSLMAANEAAGRKLNFLLQELHREFNTMGVKADKAEIAHIIVDIKAEVEKIREQVQNVE